MDKSKLWYLFLCAIAALSFGGLANAMADAKLDPDRDLCGYSIYGLIVQYIFSFLILFIFYLMRYDFKHVMATVRHLLHNKQYEELVKNTQTAIIMPFPAITRCMYSALIHSSMRFTLLCGDCCDSGIQIHFQVQTPDADNISDFDLSILFGNLLDNAIHACQKVPREERYINLSTDTDTLSSFYM